MDFQVNDLVFGKVKGYPYWPAQIVKVDSESFKCVTKFEVRFYATNQTAKLNKNNICSYLENKLKFPLESVAEKHREMYNIALRSIAKASMSPTAIKKSKTPISKPTKGNQVILKCSSSASSKEKELTAPSHSLQVGSSLNDASGTNCLSRETPGTSFSDEIQGVEDFHTKILKHELNQCKLENKNLQLVIELIKCDNEKLQLELNHLKSYKPNCARCYPSWHNTPTENSWRNVTNHGRHSVTLNTENIECKNSFSVLSQKIPSSSKNEFSNIDEAETHCHVRKNSNPNRLKDKYEAAHKADKSRKKLVILADSHGKHLSTLIEQRTHLNVCSFVRSGAKFHQVTDEVEELTKDLDEHDFLMVMAGTNNMEVTGIKRIIDDVHHVIRKSQPTNLLLATVPMRHDKPSLDLKISKVNDEIEKIAEEQSNVTLLRLHLLPRHYFTTHGLHFNKRGKANIAKTVAHLLAENGEKSRTVTQLSVHSCEDITNVHNGKLKHQQLMDVPPEEPVGASINAPGAVIITSSSSVLEAEEHYDNGQNRIIPPVSCHIPSVSCNLTPIASTPTPTMSGLQGKNLMANEFVSLT